ncbi:MAG: hypothetical protein ACRBK7_25795 [Acidimicrobiales bacterium]
MTAPWFEDDDQLLEELALARLDDAPSPDAAEMIMVGYDIVMTDTAEAALIHDSAAEELAGVRSTEVAARMLSYSQGEFEIEFELAEGRIVGHIEPPPTGVVYLEQPTASPAVAETTCDDLGGFEFPLEHPATFRLRFVNQSGDSVATGWIDGPHETHS